MQIGVIDGMISKDKSQSEFVERFPEFQESYIRHSSVIFLLSME